MTDEKETVLITGATSGIGFSLARKFAREGYSLLLVASNRKRLMQAKRRLLHDMPTGQIKLLCQDLSVDGAADHVYRTVQKAGIRVDILVNNAGFGMVGEAVSGDRTKEAAMLRLNIQAVTQLSALFLEDMYRRGRGKLLNVASVGAFMPGPYTAAYYASKAYVASYSRAIRYEAAEKGIQVCTLYPGTARTEFFERTGAVTPLWAMSPDRVAKCAYKGLMKNRGIIVPGLMNRLLRWIPSGIKLRGIAFLKKSRTKSNTPQQATGHDLASF